MQKPGHLVKKCFDLNWYFFTNVCFFTCTDFTVACTSLQERIHQFTNCIVPRGREQQSPWSCWHQLNISFLSTHMGLRSYYFCTEKLIITVQPLYSNFVSEYNWFKLKSENLNVLISLINFISQRVHGWIVHIIAKILGNCVQLSKKNQMRAF